MTAEIQITLPDALPAGDYILTVAPVSIPLKAQFAVEMDGLTATVQDTSTGGVAVHYGFSDGTNADCAPGATIVHVYPDTSIRQIKQTVTNAAGDTATASTTVYPKLPPANPPPADPPPNDPPPVSPPPPPSNNPPQVPPPATGGEGAHTAVVTATIDGKAWISTAKLGDDPSVAGPYLAPADADGNPHPGLRSRNWVDGVDVGAMAGSGTQDYAGHLHVTYDGAVVFDEDVQFPRGVPNTTIRYGPQASWHPVDLSLFPNWVTPSGPLKLLDLSGFDLSFNGLGVASYANMAAASDRPDIGFVPGKSDVPFCMQPSDETFVPVRKTADTMPWGIYFLDDNTGHPFHIDDYPMTSLLQYGEVVIPGNPIAPFTAGLNKPSLNGTSIVWNSAHETGYQFVAAAATGSARDKWHAGVWANAMLTALNPLYVWPKGLWSGSFDTRGNAWALRSVFLASFLSDEPDYYAAQLEIARQNAPPLTPLGFLGLSYRSGSTSTKTFTKSGIAMWMEDYCRVVLPVIGHKLPAWQPIAAAAAEIIVTIMQDARNVLSTEYVLTIRDSNGNELPDLTAVYQATLRGPLGTGDDGAWSEADIATATDPSVTPEVLDALLRSYSPNYAANCQLGDFLGSGTDPHSYPAWRRMAMAGAVDMGTPGAADAWAKCDALPTQCDYSGDWGRNIVPRAAA